MEASTAGAARGVSLSQSSPQKQWGVVSEHPVRNTGNDQGQELPNGEDFSSLQMDGVVNVDDRILQQKIQNLSRQRNEMQQVEIELRALLISKAEIVEMQSSFNSRFQEQAHAVCRLQEQLRDREHTIHELETRMDDKERELRALRLDNEAAWAKENLLREQNEELATFRREHDNTEAERAHHKQQILDLQELIQDKEGQLLELQDKHRVAQGTILYKDEQIREAQAWMTRVQEMDVLQSSTLQAELQGRTEQFNQLWLGWQGQYAEMERSHKQAIQQLQLELAGVRGNNGTSNGNPSIPNNPSSDGSQIAPNSGNHVEIHEDGTQNGNSGGLANVNADNSQQYVETGNFSSQANLAHRPPIMPSMLGIPSFLPPGQVTAMHPYVMHQQGAGQTVGSHVPQSHAGHFSSVLPMGSFQQWQNQQAIPEDPTKSSQNQYSLSQAGENSSRSESNYGYDSSINGQSLHQDYLSNYMGQRVPPNSQIACNQDVQTLESVERSYFADLEAQHNLQQISSQFHEALRLDPLVQTNEIKAHQNHVGNNASNEPVSRDVITEQPSSTASPSPSESSVQPVHVTEASSNCTSQAVLSTEKTNSLSSGEVPEAALLDERALLACIVRTIPPGGKIRISSTLPNRLGKMLAPLHWHDYKKKYGKLDDFVAYHPELFVIQGDQIQLREGAQGIIAATSAVAKVAAAAASSSPYPSLFPSVAVTPMSDTVRVKKLPSMESNALNSHYSNGSAFIVAGTYSNVKILSKPKDPSELVPAENGGLGNPGSKVRIHSRMGANFIGKQQAR